MRAIVCEAFGDESVMHMADVQPPPMIPGGLRIRVRATAVNRADLLQRQGHYPPPAGASELLGLECAGEVIETTSAEWNIGARVMALLPGGGYAEEVVVDAGCAIGMPDAFSWEEAGALPEVFLTAYLTIFELARARAGESILVHGGGSGIGTAAITLAKLARVRAIVTAGSDEKCRRCVEHGAADAINYRTGDFVSRAKGVNVILDHIGPRYLAKNLEALASGGRLVLIGMMGGNAAVSVDLASLLAKRQQIIGSTLRARPAEEKATIVASFLQRFGADLYAGKIRPVIDSVFPLERAADAHLRMNEDHFGKIVLTTP